MHKTTLEGLLLSWQGFMMRSIFKDGEVMIHHVYRRKTKLWEIEVVLDLGYPEVNVCRVKIPTRDLSNNKLNVVVFTEAVLEAMERAGDVLRIETGRHKLGVAQC